MNRRAEQDRGERTQREAIAWLLRLDAPDAGEADWLALRSWLEAAPEHRDAFDRAERVSAELAEAASDILAALTSRPIAPLPRRPVARRARPGVQFRRAAAVLAAAAAALVVFVALRPPAPAATQLYQTAKGESRMFELADGSRIHLNSGSRLAVRLERKARHVELTEGEAAFDVATDAARPFLIAAGQSTIRVVGTEFDVLNHQGRLRVTVRRGVVAVQPSQGATLTRAVLLHAGDQLDRKADGQVATVRRVDADAAFAWKGGDLVYRNQPLGEVVEDLNRYFTTPIRVAGPAADLRFSGVLVIDSEEAVVRRLQAFLPLAVDREPDGLTLRRR